MWEAEWECMAHGDMATCVSGSRVSGSCVPGSLRCRAPPIELQRFCKRPGSRRKRLSAETLVLPVMEVSSPRARTSMDYHYELDNSYVREVASRQGMAPTPEPALFRAHTTMARPATSWAPKQNLSMTTGHLPAAEAYGRAPSRLPAGEAHDRAPSQLMYRSTSNSAYRPPSQYAYRPPSQSVYRPPTQLAYRPTSQLGFGPTHRERNVHYPLANDEEIPMPEPIKCDDEQIFIRKPRCTTVTPPIFRMGSHGAPWKHVKSFINSNGSHLCWIDGVLKQEENVAFPTLWTRHQPRRMIRRTLNKPVPATNTLKYWHQANAPTKYTDYSKMTA